MKYFTLSLFVIFIIFSFGCKQLVDIESEKSEILKILAADDQELLDGVLEEDSEDTVATISIMKGNMERITGSEANRRNRTLLEKGKFVKIENLDGPVINVSQDGQMAWVAVKTKFVIAYVDSEGTEKEWEGIEARLVVFEKKNNEWDGVACAQTY